MGEGECAGEVVSLAEFGFTAAESTAFEAQLLLDERQFVKPRRWRTTRCCRPPARWCKCTWPDAPSDPAAIVHEFKTRFVDTKIFWDTYHPGQFANYLINRHGTADTRYTKDTAHKIVEEANLFIDAAHKADAKYRQSLMFLPAQLGMKVASPEQHVGLGQHVHAAAERCA